MTPTVTITSLVAALVLTFTIVLWALTTYIS
jgi:hypothetical protein